MSNSLKEFQESLPWTELWSEDYKKDPRSYKHLEHCLINIIAKAGSLLQAIELADHYGEENELSPNREDTGRALAIIILSAFKAGQSYKDSPIDISKYIERDLKRRINEKPFKNEDQI